MHWRKFLSLIYCAILIIVTTNGVLDTPTWAADGMVIHVAPTGTDEPSCGALLHPCRTLQYAAGQVASGGVIKVAQGVYTAPDGSPAVLDLTFGPGQEGKDITIIGGYLPPNWDIPSSDPLQTVLDGRGVQRVINIVSVPSIRVYIQGVTVQNGLVNFPSLPDGLFSGGGLYCLNDHPDDTSAFVTVELNNVVFRNNKVVSNGPSPASGGGASFYRRCRAFLENVVFEGNEVRGGDATDGTRGAHALGGGLFATMYSDVVARGLVIRQNTAQAGSGGRGYGAHEWDRADGLGGGAAFQYNSVDLQKILVEGNVARAGYGSEYGGFGAGGGLFFEYSSGVIDDGEIKNNSVYGGNAGGRGGEGSGGGLMATDSQLTLSRLQIVSNYEIGGNGNDAGHAGGALYFTKASPSSVMRVRGTNLILAYNRAEAGSGQNRWGGGGGIFAQDADVILNHTTIVSNSVLSTMVAPAVIALHNFTESKVRISNSIIAFHPTSAYPRAAVISQREGDSVILENVVFWQNAGGDASTWFSGAVLTVTNSIIGDPRLSADFHLQKGSVAVDQVLPSVYTDIDGEPRPFREKADIGADEYVPIYLSVTPLDCALLLRWRTNPALVKDVSAYQIHSCEKGTTNCVTYNVEASASSYVLSNLSNYQHYLIQVNALDATGGLIESSNTMEAFPTDRLVYLPLVLRGTQ